MAYNKLRREIAALLANEEKTPVSQADTATKLESFYAFEEDGGSLGNCKDWITFRNAALRDRCELIIAYRVLRKVLITLGGPVVETRPVPVDTPTAQTQHPCDTPAVEQDAPVVGDSLRAPLGEETSPVGEGL